MGDNYYGYSRTASTYDDDDQENRYQVNFVYPLFFSKIKKIKIVTTYNIISVHHLEMMYMIQLLLKKK